MSPAGPGHTEGCPSESTILAFVEGAAEGRASVDAHLVGCGACRRLVSVLAGASQASAAPSGSPPASLAAAVEPGAVIAGKFEVVSVLGRGGMGLVVEAHHRTLGQRVALKFLQGGLARDPSAVSRFFREARAAASLGSEHVVRVLDADWLPSGEPFIALELLEGRDLAAELRASGRLGVAEAVSYVLQACEALLLAHQKGIVHRDIKPANLFLTRGVDGAALVKVLDFGVAKVRSTAEGTSTTDPSAVVGSPRYMSPEQLQASASVDARADVWALGVTLFELLTCAPPFAGDGILEICAAIVTGPPARLTDLLPGAPPGLAAAIDRSLAKVAAERTPDILAFAEDIAPFAGDEGASRIARLRRVARVSHAPASTPAPRSAPISGGPGADSTLAASSLVPSRLPARSVPWPLVALGGAALAAAIGWAVLRAPAADPTPASAARAAATERAPAVETAEPVVAAKEASASVTASASVPASASAGAEPARKQPAAAAAPPAAKPGSSSSIHRDGLLDRK